MGKTYAVATEFSVVDRASRVLDKINSSGNRMTRAAEARFQAFGVTAQKAVIELNDLPFSEGDTT